MLASRGNRGLGGIERRQAGGMVSCARRVRGASRKILRGQHDVEEGGEGAGRKGVRRANRGRAGGCQDVGCCNTVVHQEASNANDTHKHHSLTHISTQDTHIRTLTCYGTSRVL